MSVLTPIFQSFIKDTHTHTHTHTHTKPGTLSLIIVLNNLTAITGSSVVIKNLRTVKLI